ncbi:MAG: hypothetical protein J6U17_05095, partial [Kiritimatiellae bacterium]|nr:hypothetical protein [Kiritimatiellia bacterium]
APAAAPAPATAPAAAPAAKPAQSTTPTVKAAPLKPLAPAGGIRKPVIGGGAGALKPGLKLPAKPTLAAGLKLPPKPAAKPAAPADGVAELTPVT